MNQGLTIKLDQLLTSLSFVLDIAENRYYNHSRRTAYIAYFIAVEMGMDEEDIIDIYHTALIHDIGMAGLLSRYNVHEIHLDEGLKKDHCEFGYEILKGLPLRENMKKYILYHHEEWGGTGPFSLREDDIPLGAQIIHVADYFELNFIREFENKGAYQNIEGAGEWLKSYENKAFNREICSALSSIILREKFWLDLKTTNMVQALWIIQPNKNITIDRSFFIIFSSFYFTTVL